MTTFSNRICRTLQQDHRTNIALLLRVEALISGRPRVPPDVADPAIKELLSELATAAAAEVGRHFDFEERGLFSYLDTIGEKVIGADLTEEHAVIRPLVARLTEAARQAAAQGFDEASWSEFRRLGMELCERLPGHIQKEEAALLPLIQDNMDAETEARLYQDYVENA